MKSRSLKEKFIDTHGSPGNERKARYTRTHGEAPEWIRRQKQEGGNHDLEPWLCFPQKRKGGKGKVA